MKKIILSLMIAVLLLACGEQKQSKPMSNIAEQNVTNILHQLQEKYPAAPAERMERGVRSVAARWMEEDGTAEEFEAFCIAHFADTEGERDALFDALERNFEAIYGRLNDISIDLKFPIHVVDQPESKLDDAFAGLDPFAHFLDDMFESKIAFVSLLNFPVYTLAEKNAHGADWTRRDWAEARLGDWFAARVPAQVTQNISNCLNEADTYISDYNIMMDRLRNDAGEQLFPSGMMLISHWGLRDELKSNYANADGRGLEKQQMIYEVMQRIIDQTIPQAVISDATYTWNPYSNEVRDAQGQLVPCEREADVRYQMLLNNFRAEKAHDVYCPDAPTCIERSFAGAMEVSDQEIETMFTQFISSPEVVAVANLIQQRLGRSLQPFDIWYDGFKSRSSISEDELSAITRNKYPTTQAFEQDMPSIMTKLGFTAAKAEEVSRKVVVDRSRGAGHAWGAMSRQNVSRLRSRIGADGCDYKGYNIACHEFGHNVEQTITMNDVDSYFMSGVPSTAFTEALAFVFQKRDLQLLGMSNNDSQAETLRYLDIFWGCYEIMGVSLVDLYTWRWLYAHPEATVSELKEAVIANAKQVWNSYYAPVLGVNDSPILGIYSHMIDTPLYLSNYPYGHIVESQLEQQFTNRVLGEEVCRIYPVGRLTPNLWMRHAVGTDVSIEPLLEQTRKAIANYMTPLTHD
ncbi:MAG: hypothetical protein MJZ89_06355 [Paludibacteraceae bacterium]|nr:hypothetical protein [Paludibacteraceae bacterium]